MELSYSRSIFRRERQRNVGPNIYDKEARTLEELNLHGKIPLGGSQSPGCWTEEMRSTKALSWQKTGQTLCGAVVQGPLLPWGGRCALPSHVRCGHVTRKCAGRVDASSGRSFAGRLVPHLEPSTSRAAPERGHSMIYLITDKVDVTTPGTQGHW